MRILLSSHKLEYRQNFINRHVRRVNLYFGIEYFRSEFLTPHLWVAIPTVRYFFARCFVAYSESFNFSVGFTLRRCPQLLMVIREIFFDARSGVIHLERIRLGTCFLLQSITLFCRQLRFMPVVRRRRNRVNDTRRKNLASQYEKKRRSARQSSPPVFFTPLFETFPNHVVTTVMSETRP